jgi:hypothetical protein
MTRLAFDKERDCREFGVVQDVQVSTYLDMVFIEQWDGTGDHVHTVVIPARVATMLAGALVDPSEDYDTIRTLP